MKPLAASITETESPEARMTSWKVGDNARIATYGAMHWVHILKISYGIATALSEHGNVEYWSLGSLETRASYLASCERMRDEWTGGHYRKMIVHADREFEKPAKWQEWLERSSFIAVSPVTQKPACNPA